jgi:flagellar basal-body rod protein FlgF
MKRLTNGFQRDFEQRARVWPLFGECHPLRLPYRRPGTDFTFGALQETGRKLDVAAAGEARTKMHKDTDNFLVTVAN